MSKKQLLAVFILLALTAGFVGGWMLKNKFSATSEENIANKLKPLRLGGYKFTEPLLVCDVSSDKESPNFSSLEQKLQNLINNEVQKRNINSASVYLRDLKTGDQISINKDEKFFPSSLRKVPLMITVFKTAEADPSILKKISATFNNDDQNQDQEIKPKDYAKIGQSYTLDILVEKMIKSSDNNAAFIFSSLLDADAVKTVYNDLKVPFLVPDKNITSTQRIDYMTTYNFAYFFRVLFNATYLSKDLSEKALELLSETDFKDGLVAGVPQNITVAHKFGLTTLKDKAGNLITRELHDCGIVYFPQSPYLLCIMTKSTAAIPEIEETIKNISAATYKEFGSYKFTE